MDAQTMRVVFRSGHWVVAVTVGMAIFGCDGSAEPDILAPYESEPSAALLASGSTRSSGSRDAVPVLLLPERKSTTYGDLPDGLRRCVEETLDALAGIVGAEPADSGCTFEGSQGSIGGNPPATWSVTCFAPNGCRCTITHGTDGHFSTCSCPDGD